MQRNMCQRSVTGQHFTDGQAELKTKNVRNAHREDLLAPQRIH